MPAAQRAAILGVPSIEDGSTLRARLNRSKMEKTALDTGARAGVAPRILRDTASAAQPVGWSVRLAISAAATAGAPTTEGTKRTSAHLPALQGRAGTNVSH